jgi:type II secretory pathway component PulF
MSDSPGSNGTSGGGRLSGAEALELSAQLAGLARAGLPLAPSLAALAEELPRGRLRRSMRDLARGLGSGQLLGEALGDQQGRVPAHLRGLVVAGVRSGRLGEVLGEFADFAAIGVELRRRLWLSLAYPLLTTLLTLSVFAFVGIAVLPQFDRMFADFGVPLPGVTIVVLRLMHRTAVIWPTLATIAGVLVAGGLAARLFLPPALTRSLMATIPVLGSVSWWTSLAEFCHLLGLLLEHRLPMPEALRLAGEGVQDAGLEAISRLVAEDVEDGKTLAESMARRRGFPPRLPRLLRWGENQGSLPDVLHMAGELFAARASAQATTAATAATLACFFFILTGIVLVVGSLMFPLITLIAKLSG